MSYKGGEECGPGGAVEAACMGPTPRGDFGLCAQFVDFVSHESKSVESERKVFSGSGGGGGRRGVKGINGVKGIKGKAANKRWTDHVERRRWP
eukprot:6214576-Pleurochrysis_carterae.AAC.1